MRPVLAAPARRAPEAPEACWRRVVGDSSPRGAQRRAQRTVEEAAARRRAARAPAARRRHQCGGMPAPTDEGSAMRAARPRRVRTCPRPMNAPTPGPRTVCTCARRAWGAGSVSWQSWQSWQSRQSRQSWQSWHFLHSKPCASTACWAARCWASAARGCRGRRPAPPRRRAEEGGAARSSRGGAREGRVGSEERGVPECCGISGSRDQVWSVT